MNRCSCPCCRALRALAERGGGRAGGGCILPARLGMPSGEGDPRAEHHMGLFPPGAKADGCSSSSALPPHSYRCRRAGMPQLLLDHARALLVSSPGCGSGAGEREIWNCSCEGAGVRSSPGPASASPRGWEQADRRPGCQLERPPRLEALGRRRGRQSCLVPKRWNTSRESLVFVTGS